MPFGPHSGKRLVKPIALALSCMAMTGGSVSQNTSRGTPAIPPAIPSGSRPGASDPHVFPPGLETDILRDDPSIRVMRQNARRDDMKKRMEQNATRLLRLTAELRNDLQTREPTEADSKRLDEIAKLAHAVREQMKQ